MTLQHAVAVGAETTVDADDVIEFGYRLLVAVEEWGALRGGWLTLRRILSCRPGVPAGYDPVPTRPERRIIVSSGRAR